MVHLKVFEPDRGLKLQNYKSEGFAIESGSPCYTPYSGSDQEDYFRLKWYLHHKFSDQFLHLRSMVSYL